MWDNPGGQLPGTGIRGDGENLHDRRSTQRVMQVSVLVVLLFFYQL